MKKKTVSIGGATYDLFVRTNHEVISSCEDCKHNAAFTLPLGAKIRVKEVIETCGGGASNTSVGFARLGCDASFCGIVGSDQWGEKLVENFRKEGVNTDCMTTVEGEVTSFSLILSASGGERVILYDSGTNTHLHDATFDRAFVDTADWVYLNHIQEDSCVIQDDLIAMLANDELQHFTWNPGGHQIEIGFEEENNTKLLSQTDLLLLNKEEALAFSQTRTVDDALHAFINLGVRIVCITDGANGTIATDGTKNYHCPIVKDTKVIDTTGAGDAFGTGATWALLQGYDLPTALKTGTINSASVVSAIGAQAGLLTDTEIIAKLQATELQVEVSAF